MMGVYIFQFKAYLQYCYLTFPTGKRSLLLDGSYVILSVFNSVSALKEYMYLSSFDSITFIGPDFVMLSDWVLEISQIGFESCFLCSLCDLEYVTPNFHFRLLH